MALRIGISFEMCERRRWESLWGSSLLDFGGEWWGVYLVHLLAQSIFEISSDLQVSKQVIHKLLKVFCAHGLRVALVTFMIWVALIEFLVARADLLGCPVYVAYWWTALARYFLWLIEGKWFFWNELRSAFLHEPHCKGLCEPLMNISL